MRLNALHPEDNPMETLLYCFGGDGGDDNGGGDSMDDDPDGDFGIDFDDGPGFDDGDTGDTGDSSDVGGSSDDQDSMDSGYDTSTVGAGTNTDMGGGGADTQDAQMDELDAISEQFDAMDQAIAETGGAAIGGDGSVSGRGTEGYEAVADTYEGITGDDSLTAGYPTEELQAGIGDVVISSLLGDAKVPPEQIADIYSSLLNTATKAEQMYGQAQPNYVETDIYGYDYPDYSTPSQQIGSTASEDPSDESTVDFDPGFYDDDTGDTGLSDFISRAFDEDNLAVKNNNPGNLKFANQPGATADARGFAKFDDPQAGMNALVNQINIDRSRGDTLEEFISDYAPPSENATQNYIDYVSERTGIAPGEQIPADKVAAVAGAITQMEGGELSTDYFSSAQSMYDTMQGDGAGVTVEFVDEGTTDYYDTFVSRDRIGTGFPVTALPEGSYKVDPETNSVALNDLGEEYMNALRQGMRDEPNKYGIDRQEIESLMAQGELVGVPMITLRNPTISFIAGSGAEGEQGAEGNRTAETGEAEAGSPGATYGGSGRFGESPEKVDGAEVGTTTAKETFSPPSIDPEDPTEFVYEYDYYNAPAGGTTQEQDASGLGIASDDSGAIGLFPGDVGLIGTGDEGLIGQTGSNAINPFESGSESDAESGAESDLSTGDTGSGGLGDADTGVGPGGGGDIGTGAPTEVADGGDGSDGADGTTTPVVEEPVIPYFFGEPMEYYDPNLPPFEYRTPLVTTPYDFARDFGSYTLSEPIAQSYAERALLAPEGLVPYTPEYMEPISEMDLARQEELLSLIGERFPGEFGEFEYDLTTSPLESAQALIDALGNQSS